MLSLDVKAIGTVRALEDGRSMLHILPSYKDGLHGLSAGDRVQILYWMHELSHSDRRTLQTWPGGDRSLPLRGVFALRSCVRPNPIGVTDVDVVEVRETGLVVVGLDARDGAPIIDIKVGWR